MYLRCTTCHAAVWVGRPSAGEAVTAVCRQCNQSYALDEGLTRSQEKIDAAARDLARDEKIDLPGAYSILFGLLNLEELREIQDPQALTPPASETRRAKSPAARFVEEIRDDEPASTGSTSADETGFDPAFGPAVEAGHLTADMARQRGDRDAFADKIVSRHSLSRAAALAVADNRTSLLAAIRKREAGDTLRVAAPATTSGPSIAGPVRLVALIAVLGLVSAFGWKHLQESRSDGGSPPFAIERDHEGRIVEVTATDARIVLDAYCVASGCEALDLMPQTMTSSRLRVGVLRQATGDDAAPDDEVLLAIPIRQNERTGRWTAGTGTTLLEPMVAPEAAHAIFGHESSQD